MKQKIRGITLIALVITIIILLILAGITITSLTNSGLFEKARQASEKYKEEQAKENEVLKEYEEWLANPENLPENTKDTKAGTLVKIPEEWYTQSPDIVQTSDGAIVQKGSKTSSAYAVSDGEANTIPVPDGFFYVGGTLDTGVVISDNEKDKNKYAGQTDVPTGVEYDDTTKAETNRTIIGNQFVWIPCNIKDYNKTDFGSTYTYSDIQGWDKTTPNGEKIQIIKYGGFYVGRYEAGMGDVKLNSGANVTQAVEAKSVNIQGKPQAWQSDIYDISKVSEDSKPTSKANNIPWVHSNYTTAYKASERMYNTSSVSSGLITGTMWDVMMNFIGETDVKTNCKWGNYSDVTLEDCKGRYTKVTMNGSSNAGSTTAWQTIENGSNKNEECYTLLSTGASETAKRKNLYDVAGNLWEWAQETMFLESYYDVYSARGGGCNTAYSTYPACFRQRVLSDLTGTNYGFRVALYIH